MVDEIVARLRLDNKSFEKGVASTIDSIDELQNSINSVEPENLRSVGYEMNNLDSSSLRNISRNIDSISKRFSAMGIVGATVINRLTNKAIDLATSLASVATSTIISGGKRRAFNLEQADFQLQGLLKNSEKVQKIMDNVSASVDGTAYSLDSAAKVASQFAATGMRAGSEMEGALKGVAGVAAMTGADYDEIGRVFTTVAGNGRLMGDQLLQLSSRGLNAAASLTKYMNKMSKSAKYTEKDIRDMVSKGEISFQLFAEAMNDAFGEHAKKANDTFNGVLSNIKAALGRIGADFYTPIIKNKGTVVKSLSTVKDTIDEIHEVTKPLAELITTIVNNSVKYFDGLAKKIDFTNTKIAIFSRLLSGNEGPEYIKSISNVFNTLMKTLTKIGRIAKSAWSYVFPDNNTYFIRKMIYQFTQLTKTLTITDETSKKLYVIFKGLASVVSIVASVIRNIVLSIQRYNKENKALFDILLDILVSMAKIIISIDSFIKRTGFLRHAIETITGYITALAQITQNILTAAFNKLAIVIEKIEPVINKLFEGLSKASESANATKPIDKITDRFNALKSSLIKTFEGIKIYLKPVIDMFKRFTGFIKQFVKNTEADASKMSLFDLIASGSILSALTALTKLLKTADGTLGSLGGTFGNFIGIFTEIRLTLEAWQQTLKADVISKIAKAILMIAGSLFVLSLIPEKNLGIAIAGLGAVVMALVSSMDKISDMITRNGLNSSKIMLYFISMATSILILSVALKKIASLNLYKMIQAIMGMYLVMEMLIRTFTKVTRVSKYSKEGRKALTSIGLLVFSLTNSIRILSKIDIESLRNGVLAFVVIMGNILLLVALLAKSKLKQVKNIKSVTAPILAITGLMLVLTTSIYKLTELASKGNLKELIASTLSIIFVLESIVVIVAILTNMKIKKRVAMTLLGFTTSIAAVLSALAVLASYNLSQIALAATSVIVILGEITMMYSIISKTKNIKWKSFAVFMAVVSTVVVITKSIIELTKLPLQMLITAAGAIAVLLGVMLVCFKMLSKLTISVDFTASDMAKAALMYTTFSAVILSIAYSLMLIQNANPMALVAAAGSTVALMLSCALVFKVMHKVTKTAKPEDFVKVLASFAILSETILAISFALSLVGSMNWEQLAFASVGLIGLLMSCVLAFKVMGEIQRTMTSIDFVKVTACFAIISVTLLAIAKALDVAKNTNLTSFVGLMGSLLAGVVIFVAAAAILGVVANSPLAIGILAVVGALMALSTAAIAFGLGSKLFAEGLLIIAKALEKLSNMKEEIGSFVDILVEEAKKVGDILLNIIEGVAKNGAAFGKAVGQLILDGIESAEKIMPKVVNAASKMLTALLTGIADNLPKLLDSFVYSVISFIDGILQALTSDKTVKKIRESLLYLCKLVETILKEGLSFIGNMAGYLIEGFIVGLFHAIGNIGTHIGNACDQIYKEFCEYWDINSPSKLMEKMGVYIIEGLIKGITKPAVNAGEAILGVCDDIANTFLDFFEINSPSKLLEKFSKYIPAGIAKGLSSDKTASNAMGDMGSDMMDEFTEGFTESSKKNKKKTGDAIVDHYGSIDERRSKAEEKMFAKADAREAKRQKQQEKLRKKEIKALEKQYEQKHAVDVFWNKKYAEAEEEHLKEEKIKAKAYEQLQKRRKKVLEDQTLSEEERQKKYNKLGYDYLNNYEKYIEDAKKILEKEEHAYEDHVKRMNKIHKGGSVKYNNEWQDRYGGQMAENEKREKEYDKYHAKAEAKKKAAEEKKKQQEEERKRKERERKAKLKQKKSKPIELDEKVITSPTKKQLVSIGAAYNKYIAFGIDKNVSKIKKSTANALSMGAAVTESVRKDLAKGGSVFSEYLDKSTQEDSKKRIKDLKKERKNLQVELENANIDLKYGKKKDKSNAKKNVADVKKQLDANSKNLKNAQRGNAITLKQSAEAFIAYRDTVKKSLEDVTKSFEALDLGETMTTKDIMSNLDSQAKGINKWLNALKVARDKGVNKDLISKWTKEGVSSYKEVGAVVGMTSKQVMSLNSKWERNQRVVKNASDIATMNLVKVGKTTKNTAKGMADMVNFNGKTYALAYKDSQKVIEQLHKINTWTIDQDIKSVRNSMAYGQASFNMLLKKYGKDKEKLGIKSAKKFLNALKVAAEKEGKILYEAAHPDEAKAYEKSIKQAKNYYERMLKKHGEFNEKTKAAKEAYLAKEREYNEQVAELYEETYSKIADNIKSYLSFSNISGANPISDFFTKVSDNSYDEYQKKKDEMEKLKSEMDKAYKEYEDASKNTNTVAQRLKASELSQVYEKAKEKYESAKDEFEGMEEISAKKFAENLKGRNDAYEEFGNQLDLLRNLGYSEDVIKYVEEQGYEAGRSYASALIAGSADKKAVNDEMKRTKKYAADRMIQESRQRMQNIKKFSENYRKLIDQGFQPELLAEYAQQGIDEANEAFSTMLEMDPDQKHQYQLNFQQSLEIPNTVITAIQKSWTNELNPSLGKAVNDIKVKSDDVKEAAGTIGSALKEALSKDDKLANDLAPVVGNQIAMAAQHGLANALTSNGNSKDSAANIAYNIESGIIEPIADVLNKKGKNMAAEHGTGKAFEGVGKAIIAGMVNGIKGKKKGKNGKDEENPVVKALVGLINTAIKKTKATAKVKSPSRVFKEIGNNLTEGLTIGIKDKAKFATEAMSNTIRSIMNTADSAEFTASPTISPVLDMDNMSTVSDLGDMAYSISSDLDKMSTLYANIEEARRYRLKVTNSLDEITKKMDNLDSSQIVTNNINMSVDGSKGAIATADEISRTLQTQVERRVAVWA